MAIVVTCRLTINRVLKNVSACSLKDRELSGVNNHKEDTDLCAALSPWTTVCLPALGQFTFHQTGARRRHTHTHHTLTHTHRVMLLQIWRGNRNREHFTYLSLKTYFKLHECVPSEWGWVIIPDKAVNLQYKNCWLQIFTSEITQHQRPETGRHQKDKWSRDFDCFQCRGFMLLFDPVYIHFCAETQSVYSSPAPAPTPHPPHPRLKLVHFHLSCWGIQVIKGNEFSGIIISLAAQRSLLSADCALQTILNLFRT